MQAYTSTRLNLNPRWMKFEWKSDRNIQERANCLKRGSLNGTLFDCFFTPNTRQRSILDIVEVPKFYQSLLPIKNITILIFDHFLRGKMKT